MENRTSNITSIIVAIISVGLIIFSVWLLSATFNNRSRETTVAVNSSSSSLLPSSSSTISSSATTSSRVTVIDPNETNPTSAISSAATTSASSASNAGTSISSSSNKSGSSSSSSTSLANGEIVATFIETTARGSNFEIVECNIANPVFCKAGFRFPYGEFDSNQNLTLFKGEIGAKYKFVGGTVADTTDGLSIGGVTPIKT